MTTADGLFCVGCNCKLIMRKLIEPSCLRISRIFLIRSKTAIGRFGQFCAILLADKSGHLQKPYHDRTVFVRRRGENAMVRRTIWLISRIIIRIIRTKLQRLPIIPSC